MNKLHNISKIKTAKYKKTASSFIPPFVTVPQSQGEDAEYLWSVKVGDAVTEGQVIAEPLLNSTGYLTRSPIPGKVMQFVQCYLPNGHLTQGVKIALSGSFNYTGRRPRITNYKDLTSLMIYEGIKCSGILNTFYTKSPVLLIDSVNAFMKQNAQNSFISSENNSKENSNKESKEGREKEISTFIIVRLCYEEPSSITDALISNLFFSKVLTASLTLLKGAGARGIVFLYDKSFSIPLKSIKYSGSIPIIFCPIIDKITKSCPIVNANVIRSSIKVAIEKGQYHIPNLQVLEEGRVKERHFEFSEQCLFVDSSTLLTLYEALINNIPLTSKYIHIGGDALKAAALLKVRLGTPLIQLANQLGGFYQDCDTAIINGFVSGNVTVTLDAPVTPLIKSIYFIHKGAIKPQVPEECINCGECQRICPKGLPAMLLYKTILNRPLLKDAIKDKEIKTEELGGKEYLKGEFSIGNWALESEAQGYERAVQKDYEAEGVKEREALLIKAAVLCDNCALCNTVCPARLPLSQVIYQKDK